MAKTFFLGLGAQKAGTTWLHAYLRSSRQGSAIQAKEYHIWDALHVAEFRLSDRRRSQNDRPEMAALRAWLLRDEENYFTYFASLFEPPDVAFAWDITPEYAGLGREALLRIRDGFAEKYIGTKAIFIMRDPVERAFSAFKMQMVNGNNNFANYSDGQIVEFLKTPRVEIRCNYDKTVAELGTAFAASSIYYGLFEEMFTPAEVHRLSNFIGIPPRPGFASRTMNATASDRALSTEMRHDLVRYYRNIYEFAAGRFPQVRSLWSGFRYL